MTGQHSLFPGEPGPHPSPAAVEGDFSSRYLLAKKTVDDRALNHHVWQTLQQVLAETVRRQPIKILEAGSGIGTMLARVIDWQLLAGHVTYVLTDCAAGQLLAARHFLGEWARRRGHLLSWQDQAHGLLQTERSDIRLVLAVAGVQELAGGCTGLAPFDLLIAHALLDLLDFPALLPGLLQQLGPGGLAYLTCNFDGETLFLPEYHGEEERQILDRYHASMEARQPGASHTGRRLLTFLQGPEMELLAAGSCDWLVHPQDRGYPDDESFFIESILAMIEREVAGKNGLPPAAVRTWADHRRHRLHTAALSFFAHHLDFLARRSPSPS